MGGEIPGGQGRPPRLDGAQCGQPNDPIAARQLWWTLGGRRTVRVRTLIFSLLLVQFVFLAGVAGVLVHLGEVRDTIIRSQEQAATHWGGFTPLPPSSRRLNSSAGRTARARRGSGRDPSRGARGDPQRGHATEIRGEVVPLRGNLALQRRTDSPLN
jgi:hypothetical protein